jgi:hypothetical protein
MTANVTPPQQQGGGTQNATPTPPVPASATVRIESNPPGAVITENGQNLGVTPLALTVDPARTDTRHFLLSLNGYQPYTLDQPPTRENGRVVAILVAAPAADPTGPAANARVANNGNSGNARSGSHGTHSRNGHAAGNGTNGANPTPTGHGLEIITER